MENLSDKAKIVYATLKMLGAEGTENSYKKRKGN